MNVRSQGKPRNGIRRIEEQLIGNKITRISKG